MKIGLCPWIVNSPVSAPWAVVGTPIQSNVMQESVLLVQLQWIKLKLVIVVSSLSAPSRLCVPSARIPSLRVAQSVAVDSPSVVTVVRLDVMKESVLPVSILSEMAVDVALSAR